MSFASTISRALLLGAWILIQFTPHPVLAQTVYPESPKPNLSLKNVAGNSFYVAPAPTGNDANPGTTAQPWRTIQKAADMMAPGDSTTVLLGTYNERVQISRSGAAGAPITFQVSGTVTMQGFTVNANYISIVGFEITNTPNANIDGNGIFVEGSYCTIENNYVHYATRGGIVLYATPTNFAETSNCIVRNNRLQRNSQFGIDVNGRNHLIEGNEIWDTIQYHPAWTDPPSWVDADGVHFHGSGHVFRKNYIHDIRFGIPENRNPHIDCFQTWATSTDEAASNTIFEQNTCDNIQSQSPNETSHAFMLGNTNGLTIRNNLLRTYSGINVHTSSNLAIVNNIFANDVTVTTANYPEGISLSSGMASTTIMNNIFYDLPGQIIWFDNGASKQGVDIGYNCAYRSDGMALSGAAYPHDLWGINPRFVNPAAKDFHLQPNSPAIDAGVTLTTVTNDFDGVPRPQGKGFDIGVYESSLQKKASPLSGRINEIVTFTITLAAMGTPITMTDTLPIQFTYMSSNASCSGVTNYYPSTRQVTYSGTPSSGSSCTVQISTRVNTDQMVVTTNTAVAASGSLPQQSSSVIILLNGKPFYLPSVRR